MLPAYDSDQELADSFNKVFENKILKIRTSIVVGPTVEYISLHDRACSLEPCEQLTPTSERELAKILSGMATTTCELDYMPTSFVKDNQNIILPALTSKVNKSLQTGTFP